MKLINLLLFTDYFMRISLKSSEQYSVLWTFIVVYMTMLFTILEICTLDMRPKITVPFSLVIAEVCVGMYMLADDGDDDIEEKYFQLRCTLTFVFT